MLIGEKHLVNAPHRVVDGELSVDALQSSFAAGDGRLVPLGKIDLLLLLLHLLLLVLLLLVLLLLL